MQFGISLICVWVVFEFVLTTNTASYEIKRHSNEIECMKSIDGQKSLWTEGTKYVVQGGAELCPLLSDHFEKLESIIAKPNSTVSITIEYPPTDLPRKLITLFIIKTSKNHLPYKILHMDGGVGNNFLKATIESDIGTGLSFIWIIETVSEVGSKEDRINSLLQDLLDKENLKNT